MNLQRPPFLRPQFVPFASATAMNTVTEIELSSKDIVEEAKDLLLSHFEYI